MSKRVSDLMTKEVVTIPADASIGDAMAALAEHECRHLPLVDGSSVVGVVGDRDVRRVEGLLALQVGSPDRSETVLGQPALGLLSGPPVTIAQTASIDEAIDRLVDAAVGTLVVTDDDGALVGMLSYVDILRAARGRF